MRIGVEACTWSNRRGYGRFLRGLFTAMLEEFPGHEYVLVVDRHTFAESRFPAGVKVEVVGTKVQPTQAASADGSRSPLDLWRMGRAVAALDVDVFFFPTRYSFFPVLGGPPTVVAFHDATAERHPELIFPGFRSRLFWRAKTWLALRAADRLVTVSEDARREIAKAFGLEAATIEVIPEGPDPAFGPMTRPIPGEAEVLGRYGIPAGLPLVLYVGGISPHKNLQGLMRAVARIGPSKPWHLVLVGDYANDSFWGCYEELVVLSRDLGIEDRVTFTGYMPDEDLVVVCNLAHLLALVSMNEGFGLPVVEAMASGLPVVASDRGSLPELVGDAGLVVDPSSDEAIAEAIRSLLDDAHLRADLSRRGLLRAQTYSWRSGARRLMSVLEEVAGSGPRLRPESGR